MISRTYLFLLLLVLPLGVFAQSAEELQSRITNQNEAIADIEKDIATYQKQLVNLSKQKNTLANALEILNIELKKTNADIAVTQGKIKTTNLKLTSLGASIEDADGTIVDLEKAIAKGIRDMYIEDQKTLTDLLLSKKGFSDFWELRIGQEALQRKISERIEELSQTKDALIIDKEAVEKAQRELLGLQRQLEDQRYITQKTKNQQVELLRDTQNKESNYQTLVSQKQALKRELENELREYESQLQYILDPSSLPTTGSKTFSWPLDNVYITQLFGKTAAAGRLYTSGSHNGIDFRASVGTPVRAMASGVVLGADNADKTCRGASYGVWVFIKYDNGLSAVFGHMSLAKVSAGQRVTRGEVIGYSGNTGYATGPHLHVSVFPNDAAKITTFNSRSCPGKTITIPTAPVNAYLDPMLYLPKI